MPIVEITYDPEVTTERLQRLSAVLPHVVSLAVECPEEPYDGHLRPGDVDVRFRPRGVDDFGGLDIVVEVRSTFIASRADTRQERCRRLCEAVVEATGSESVGVYLLLPVAAWAQSG